MESYMVMARTTPLTRKQKTVVYKTWASVRIIQRYNVVVLVFEMLAEKVKLKNNKKERCSKITRYI